MALLKPILNGQKMEIILRAYSILHNRFLHTLRVNPHDVNRAQFERCKSFTNDNYLGNSDLRYAVIYFIAFTPFYLYIFMQYCGSKNTLKF